MSNVPPAIRQESKHLSHAQIERIAYLKLLSGRISIEEFRQAIAVPEKRRRRKWWRRAGR